MALTNAANAPVEPIWATLLAKALEGKNVKELLSNVGAGGGAPAASAPVAGGSAGAGAAVEEKKEEKEEEKDEESDGDMVRYCAFGLTCGLLMTFTGLRIVRLICFFTNVSYIRLRKAFALIVKDYPCSCGYGHARQQFQA